MPPILVWDALMTRFRFSLSWLMLPLLASLSFLAIGEPLDGAAQALHLIGYIGADYPATVAGGQVSMPVNIRSNWSFSMYCRA